MFSDRRAASAAAAAAAQSAAARERAGMKETPIWSKENDVFGGKGLVFLVRGMCTKDFEKIVLFYELWVFELL